MENVLTKDREYHVLLTNQKFSVVSCRHIHRVAFFLSKRNCSLLLVKTNDEAPEGYLGLRSPLTHTLGYPRLSKR